MFLSKKNAPQNKNKNTQGNKVKKALGGNRFVIQDGEMSNPIMKNNKNMPNSKQIFNQISIYLITKIRSFQLLIINQFLNP